MFTHTAVFDCLYVYLLNHIQHFKKDKQGTI